ncbi:MBL fold metallo-hydrolase [uncultured Bacteroides sp.]|uniref:MBL fold metallo-hydrolase n=1 Tax=uncultured Bacteroides sp. TaxID=162156 RepID=UPI002AAAC478|nr:MBL fold metallo-hydrolase [uncultured Bacteroides sp.]
MKTALLFLAILFCFGLSAQQNHLFQLTKQEKTDLLKAIETDSVFASFVKDTSNALELYKQYKVNVIKSDSTWNSDQQRLFKIQDFGSTIKFELIPFVENLNDGKIFRKAEGVSYLIRTDNFTILFDTGIDDDSIMCVLRYNLDLLGIDVSEIDAIVISHNHEDHQNNWKWINDKTFINSENESILPKMNIFVPCDSLNLKIPTLFFKDPIKICEGVCTTGIIKAPLFFWTTQEQGLIINVKDKGLIIVTGCGHQTVDKLLLRCDRISDLPIYGILGGFHLPIYGDSERYMGYLITGRLPWEPFTVSDVNKKIKLIKKRNVKLIGISTHDSSVKAIEAFKKAFSKEYEDLKTGAWIVVK